MFYIYSYIFTEYITLLIVKEDHAKKILEHILILENVNMNAHNSLATFSGFNFPKLKSNKYK